MRDDLELSGHSAVNLIVARAAPALCKLWDGGNDKVAFILELGGNMNVRFMSRQNGSLLLRNCAVVPEYERHAERLTTAAAILEQGPTERTIQCVLFGWGDFLLIELEPDDLRATPGIAAPVSDQEIADTFVSCSTQMGALSAVYEIQTRLKLEANITVAELDELERIILAGWNDVSALAFATARARAATEPYLGTRAGQRTHLVLEMLGEATAKRASGGINAGGGEA